MPVHTEKKGDKWRILDPDDSVIKNNSGTAVDGGGHDAKSRAISQAQAINMNMRRESSIEDRIVNCLAIRIFGRRIDTNKG